MALEENNAPLNVSIEQELEMREKPKSYRLHEHEVVYASSSQEDSISHMADVGDVDGGKAWKAVRRPSDMVRLKATLSFQWY